jgi:FkbM family methyltransferase
MKTAEEVCSIAAGKAEATASRDGSRFVRLLRDALYLAPSPILDFAAWWVRSSSLRTGAGTLADKVVSPVARRRGAAKVIRTADGLELLVNPSRSDLVQLYLYMFRVWEPVITAWLKTVLKPGDVVVDVGANIGYYTTLAAKAVGPTGRVIAIEPFPETFTALRDNVRRNGLTNVELVNAAVGDGAVLSLYQDPSGALGTISMLQQPGWKHVADVPTTTIEKIVAPDLRGRLRLVKIDAEGAEDIALRSMGGLLDLTNDKLTLLVECGPSERQASVTSLLKEKGFGLKGIRNYYGVDDYVRPPRVKLEMLAEQLTSQIDVVATRRSGDLQVVE